MSSPSKRRREGRNAYYPLIHPIETCPYKDPYYAGDWLEGWREEEKRQKEEENRGPALEERVEALEAKVQKLIDLIEETSPGVRFAGGGGSYSN